MNWKRTIVRNMTALMFSGVLLSPFVSNANEFGSHGSQTIASEGNHQTMNSNNNDSLESAMAHMYAAERSFVRTESHGNQRDRISARQRLLDSEHSVISHLATQAHLPYSTVERMHSSGASFYQIGFDLRIAGWPRDFVDNETHMMIFDQVHNDLDMTNIGMNGAHMTGYSNHSGNSHGYSTIQTNGSYNHQDLSSRGSNYGSHGGSMNAMH